LNVRRLTNTWAVILLLTATAAAYWTTLGNDFLWDDEMLVVSNSYIRNTTYLAPAFRTDLFHGHAGWVATHYRPLQTVSYMIDYAIWGLNPFGYHLTNLLLHALCVVLVYAMIRRFFGNIYVAFGAALLFAVHPVNTNAISYIAGRADPMAFAGMLGALLLFDSYCRQRSIVAFAGAVLCYLAALFSRENSMLFPVLVLLYSLIINHSSWRKAILSALPFAVLAVALGVIRHYALTSQGQVSGFSWALPFSIRWQIPFRALATYFGLLVWPARLQMERQVVFGSPSLPALTAAGIAAAIGLVALARRQSREVRFGVLWFIVAVIPMLGIFSLNASVAEHWIYVPSVGLYLAVLTLPHRPLTRAIFAIAILALMTRTIVRNRDWADAATFYARTIKAAPYSASVRANLSHEFAVNGNEDRALAELLAAERLDPKYPTVKLKLAAAYMARGDRVQARAKLDECLALMPRNTAALLLAAEIVEQDNDLYRARQLLLAAMDTTSNPLPWMRYAEFLQRHHENDKALTVVRQALTLEPGNATLHNLAGILLADTGDRAGAEQEFRTATTFDRHAPDAWINLGRLAARRDQWPAALTAYQRALQIAPDSPVAGYQIAIVHWKLGDRAQAEQELRRVHDAWPENRDIGSALDRLQRGETPPELRD